MAPSSILGILAIQPDGKETSPSHYAAYQCRGLSALASKNHSVQVSSRATGCPTSRGQPGGMTEPTAALLRQPALRHSIHHPLSPHNPSCEAFAPIAANALPGAPTGRGYKHPGGRSWAVCYDTPRLTDMLGADMVQQSHPPQVTSPSAQIVDDRAKRGSLLLRLCIDGPD